MKNHSMEEKEIKISDKKLLDDWEKCYLEAMSKLYEEFKPQPENILTESDLKCWLFHYLQRERLCTPFAVHTEVTHHALHLIKTSDDDSVKVELKKKHKFRDLSLLHPMNIKDQCGVWDDRIDGIRNTKGFKHKGPAIHFELKLVRRPDRNKDTSGLKEDLDKVASYKPDSRSHERRFVIVAGSRTETTKVSHFHEAARNKIEVEKKSIPGGTVLIFFDKQEIKAYKVANGMLKEQTL